MLLLLITAIIVLSCLIGIILKKVGAKYIIVSSAALLIFVFQLINVLSQETKIILDNDILQIISQQKWDDVNKLSEMGFENYGEYYIIHYDNEDYLCRIKVTIQKDNFPTLKNEFQNFSYNAYESGLGCFDINRLFTKENIVTRRCYIHLNNVEIYILEDNFEKSPVAFKEFFKQLYKDL